MALAACHAEPMETSGKFPVEECAVEPLVRLIAPGRCDFRGNTNAISR